MCPAVGAAFDLMDAAANAAGVDLVVVSGFRSDAEQAVLFARHPDPKWVAPPGRSRHRDATELDLNMHNGGGGAYAWLSRNGARFGFVQRYSWEPWHWGYLPGCGPSSGPLGPGRSSGGRPLGGRGPGLGAGHGPRDDRTAAMANGVAPGLLAALLRSESGFDPRAVSPAGAQGIAQLMPATARGLGVRDPFDPYQAIPAAARLLGGHLRAFGSVPLALAAYNAGPGAVRRYGGVPPFRETQAYVARVIALAGGAGALGAPERGRRRPAARGRPLRLICVCWHTMKRTTIKLPDELDQRLRREAVRRGSPCRSSRARRSPPTSAAARSASSTRPGRGTAAAPTSRLGSTSTSRCWGTWRGADRRYERVVRARR